MRAFLFELVTILSLAGQLPVSAQTTIPYKFDKKPMPKGKDFSKILPKSVAGLQLVEFTPPRPDMDGEATYKGAAGEVFMLFSWQESDEDVREVMKTIHEELKKSKVSRPAMIETRQNPYFLQYLGPKVAFFAWNRGGYCFSVDVKKADGKLLDAFVGAFPH